MESNNTCACCEGISPETPLRIHNRPGLSAVVYRAGTWVTFRESLLAALSDPRFPALRALTTRENDDFSIALLDAWAVTADVLTFYQERIANESWLGTATEQRSIVELARLIGYELRPGVAASTYLAFTMDKANMPEAQMQVTGNIRAKENYVKYPIPKGTRIQSIPGPDEKPQIFETSDDLEAMAEWNAIKPKMTQKQKNLANNDVLVFKNVNSGLKTNDLLYIVEGQNKSFKKIAKIESDDKANTITVYFSLGAIDGSLVELSPLTGQQPVPLQVNGTNTAEYLKKFRDSVIDQTHFTTLQLGYQDYSLKQLRGPSLKNMESSAAPDAVYVFRKRANAFGYNAAKTVKYDNSNHPKPASEWTELKLEEISNVLYLDGTYEDVTDGSYIVVEHENGTKVPYQANDVKLEARTAYGMTSKSTRISLKAVEQGYSGVWWGGASTLKGIRSLNFYVASERLTLAESPIIADVSGNQMSLSGYFPELKAGMAVILFGEEKGTGIFVTELRFLKQVFKVKEDTVLVFDQNLKHTYIRSTLSINANVVRATHGETVKETLGNGDASKIFQKFLLRQTPLTFTSAETPSGTLSSLEVRVNDLLWKEVPTLYGTGPQDKVFITRQDDEAKTTLIFGDGITGARLPTGQNNITATYRKGIGTEGLLQNDQLTQAVDRPLGLKAVTNPMPSIGAEDREALEDARNNASLTIYTLGRVVSLQDYEDFARAFAGIAKSLATLTWSGRQQRIHLSVAGYKGAAVPPGSPVYNNLYAALQKSGIPGVPFELANYTPIFFNIEARLRTHPDYIRENVLKDAEMRLRTEFSFEKRNFGQGVARSEVLAILQNTEGVLAVDLDYFYKTDTSKTLKETIRARIPMPEAIYPIAAELLTLNTQSITFLDMP
jgi:predicted phage baseplate assembly protein